MLTQQSGIGQSGACEPLKIYVICSTLLMESKQSVLMPSVFKDRNNLRKEFLDFLPEGQVLSRPIERVGYASDASVYRLIPQLVVQPKTDSDIQEIFRRARRLRLPVVFRAAGTSLSGQSITDGILVDLGRYWRSHEILQDGAAIWLQPGVIGEHANRYLQRHHRKIGPDPASLSACMIGGIVANNASGMRCGVQKNAYHTLQEIRFILPNGHVYDSREPDTSQRFRNHEPRLVMILQQFKKRIENDKGLQDAIRQKYQRKNTTGYGLNAFLDFQDPFEIFCHLLVGSEGTLAFISDVTLRTIPEPPFKATGLIVCPSLEETVSLVGPLRDLDAGAVELMDRASLASVENQKGIPEAIKTVSPEAAAVLVELQAESQEELQRSLKETKSLLQHVSLEYFSGFSEERVFQDRLWKIRKGLYPSVGAVRETGTSVIIEDIAFPLEKLAPATRQVRSLLDNHGYKNGIIFGHAKDGNLHFVITQKFDAGGTRQYQALIEDMVQLVVKEFNGALKAEHGTGRNMAPFVETEWGAALFEGMQSLKRAADPSNILNPGVIINQNPNAHVEDIKQLPSVESYIDTCVECGFCEPVCPSRDLTTTPRRRIAIWREITRLAGGSPADRQVAAELKAAYQYDAIDTCAADGMCSTACPVDIDTGKLMKYLRGLRTSETERFIADWSAGHFALVINGLRNILTAARHLQTAFGKPLWEKMVEVAYRLTDGAIPHWNTFLPGGAPIAAAGSEPEEQLVDVVYFPSCLSRSMGSLPGEVNAFPVSEAVCRVLDRAGLTHIYPTNLKNLCCGTPWNSKGYHRTSRGMAEKVTQALWISTRQGAIPVLVDTSPCSFAMIHYDEILEGEPLHRWEKFQFYDIVQYLHDEVLPRLPLKKQPGKVICHPTCSTMKMEQENMLLSIARQCSEEAVIPEEHGCCGFAGDRGLLFPEVTQSATRLQAEEIAKIRGNIKGYYSTSRTCEVGMSSATGHIYSSIIHLVEKASRP